MARCIAPSLRTTSKPHSCAFDDVNSVRRWTLIFLYCILVHTISIRIYLMTKKRGYSLNEICCKGKPVRSANGLSSKSLIMRDLSLNLHPQLHGLNILISYTDSTERRGHQSTSWDPNCTLSHRLLLHSFAPHQCRVTPYTYIIFIDKSIFFSSKNEIIKWNCFCE